MRMNEALIQAKQESLTFWRQVWIWTDGAEFFIGFSFPKGQTLFARVIGDELLRWDGNNETVDRI